MSEETQPNQHLVQLVLSLHAGAMQAMGKVASPITGKIERDLVMAQASIDMIAMLSSKMEGNLTDEEKKMLTHILYELRMNFVDESKKVIEPTSDDEGQTDQPESPADKKDDEAK